MSQLKILCLHGNHQCGQTFSNQIEKLQRKLKDLSTFTFVDAPFEVALKEEQDVAMRSWYEKEERKTLPKESLAVIEEAWISKGPFDGLLCFSQGCVVACHFYFLNRFPINFIVFYSGLLPDGVERSKNDEKFRLPTLHYFSPLDDIVPIQLSKELSSVFEDPETYKHRSKHRVCQKKGGLDCLRTFLKTISERLAEQKKQNKAESNELSTDIKQAEHEEEKTEEVDKEIEINDENLVLQTEELEALQSMFLDEELTVKSAVAPVEFQLRLNNLQPILSEIQQNASLSLHFKWPLDYPSSPLKCTVIEKGQVLTIDQITAIEELMALISLEEKDSGACSYLVSAQAEEWFSEALTKQDEEESDEDPDFCGMWKLEVKDPKLEAQIIKEATKEALAFATTRNTLFDQQQGKWRYTIGLVGKPSAGKSTFFNGATNPVDEKCEAKVGAFPFTTINPNTAQGSYTDTVLGEPQEIPILVKDVAGLVPGAYQGRGKGNAFLNDLLDADVLLHIMDGSGRSDREGNEGEKGDPVDDVAWVGEEIHRWIADNVRRKWAVVLRKQDGLQRLFTGYHCTKDFVDEALQRMPDAGPFLQWNARALHRLVAHFIAIRFPILLVMNKLDKPECFANVERVQSAYPHSTVVQISAKTEWTLCKLRREGFIEYDRLSNEVKWIKNEKAKSKFEKIQNEFLEKFKTTGVLDAINMAVSLKPPIAMFPVQDFDSMKGLSSPERLSDCILMKPGSNVGQLHHVLATPPLQWVRGQYIMANIYIPQDKASRIVQKHEKLTNEFRVIQVLTNKKNYDPRKKKFKET